MSDDADYSNGFATPVPSNRIVVFGGDVNHRAPCAPHGFWTRTDSSAHQNPGDQHVYGTGALRSPRVEVLSATHTDHDVLVVRAHLSEHQ